MKIYYFILLFFLYQIKCERHPILLIPGLGASRLDAKYVGKPPGIRCHSMNMTFTVWIEPLLFLPKLIDCTIDLLKLDYNTSTKITSSPKYCDVSVPGFGTVDTIDYLGTAEIKLYTYFGKIIKELVTKHNYKRNVDLRGAPYDFRKAPNEIEKYYSNVKNLIEEMYSKSNNKSVILIAHSMGNLHILKILNRMSQTWKDKYIRSFISISAPYGGAITAVQCVLSGYSSLFIYLNLLKIRKMESTWPSFYYLFPVYSMWSNDSIVLLDDRNFSANEIPELLKYSKIQYAVNHYKDTLKDIENRTPPNVEIHCLFGINLQTASALDYRGKKFPDSSPRLITTNGDGTVPIQSLMVCPNWKMKQKQKVTLQTISKVDHLGMLKNKQTVDIVSKIVHDINSN